MSSPLTKEFFSTVQNKMHFSVHGNTAAEVIVNRANHEKEHMGLTNWKNKLDIFLQFNEREVLDNPGKVSHKVAESFALSEFEKYRVIQDKLFTSDFDKFMIELKNEEINN